MWIRAVEGGWGQPMWIIFKFHNIIIKSANVDKGGGAKTLIHKMWIKRCVFFNPSLMDVQRHFYAYTSFKSRNHERFVN